MSIILSNITPNNGSASISCLLTSNKALPMTVEFWFNITLNGVLPLTELPLLFTASQTSGFYLLLTFSAYLSPMLLYIQASDNRLYPLDENFSYNQWYHFAMVYTQGNVKIYKNGELKHSVNNAEITEAPYNLTFGTSTFSILSLYNIQVSRTEKYAGSFTPSKALPFDMNIYSIVAYALFGTTVIEGGQLVKTTGYQTVVGTQKSGVNFTNVAISESVPPGASVAEATICFVTGTPVLTDNEGYVPINELIPDHHRINGETVLAVTETVTPESHLVLIAAGALAPGVPCLDTKVSINHKILTADGDMTEAGKLLGTGVHLIDYNQETLYNVVLPIHGKMTVNNMIVETLDPEFLLAKLFIAMKNIPQDQRDNLTSMYNNYVKYLLAGV